MNQLLKAAIAAWVGVLLSVDTASAQVALPFSLEARGGYAIPRGEWSEADNMENGWGYGFNAQYQLIPMVSAYAGWDRHSFAMELRDEINQPFDGRSVDSGFRFGGQLSLPRSALARVTAFAFLGATYRKLAIVVDQGNVSGTVESRRTLGVETGGGLDIPLASIVTLTPALNYRFRTAEFEHLGSADFADTDVSALTIDLGLRFGI
jgi:hypothetical protein